MLGFYIVLAAACVIGLAAFVSARVRGGLCAIWDKWFRKSHVMAIADMITVAGLGLLADPAMMTFLSTVFHDRPWLVPGIGIALRFVRRLNDPDMKIGG